jgi:hypothetical protein
MCNKTVTLTGESNEEICSENFGEAENVTIYSINEANLRGCPHIELTIGERQIIGLIDTDDEVSLISEALYNSLAESGLKFLELTVCNSVLLSAFG